MVVPKGPGCDSALGMALEEPEGPANGDCGGSGLRAMEESNGEDWVRFNGCVGVDGVNGPVEGKFELGAGEGGRGESCAFKDCRGKDEVEGSAECGGVCA